MKIYNEVVSIFNDVTGLWEITSEDSFDYNGPVALAQGGMPPNATAINTSDTIADTRKTTTGYFTGGDGTLDGNSVITASLGSKPSKYFFNINHKLSNDANSETQFSVTFGHMDGSGSNQYGDSTNNPKNIIGETKAIYKQLAHTLLDPNDAEAGFIISSSKTGGSASQPDTFVYALIGKRDKFKDRFNKKAWTLVLSGSSNTGTFSSISLTDDSKTVAAVATAGGPRHNIVLGTLGAPTTPATTSCYGWFYPEMGIMLFSGHQLAEAMPGQWGATTAFTKTSTSAITASCSASFDSAGVSYTSLVSAGGDVPLSGSISSSGFVPNLNAKGNSKNALRLARCMRNNGATTTFRMRSEEDQTQENYFCRIRAEQYNFSANPTFVSGSKNKLQNTDMFGDPQTFITGLGLYNSAGQLLAIANLSKPLLKNFASEATVKVKLTY